MIVIDKEMNSTIVDCCPCSKRTETTKTTFEDSYRIENRIHSGAYGTVYRVTSLLVPPHLSKSYAVKIIPRQRLKPTEEEDVLKEVAVMRDLANVAHVCKLVDFFVEPDTFYIVQELAMGGDLFDLVANGNLYSESEARTLANNLLKALQEIHSRGIVHRDLKPENILIANARKKTAVLLADFGFATHLPEEGYLTRRCGTHGFIAPEVVRRLPYNQSADLFGLGCILFYCICGLLPFFSDNKTQSFAKVCSGDFDFRSFHWNTVSVPAKQFLMGLLAVDPRQRWTVEQALESTWIKEGLTDALFGTIDWKPNRCHGNDLGQSMLFNFQAANLG